MAIQLKYMEGKEFVRQALSGERDFSKTRLEEGFDLSGYESFDELQKYLKNQNLKENPFAIDYSQLKGVKAMGIYLPYVKGREADLEGANLGGAYLGGADLERAYLERADLLGAYLGGANLGGANLEGANLKGAYIERANLKGAYLGGANIWEANLRGANLERTDLERANLRKTDLRGANLGRANLKAVKNLDEVLNLEEAIFCETRVSEKEKAIIESALKERPRFIVE